MVSATQSKELKFHFVHKDDLAPAGYDKVRKDTGEIDPMYYADEVREPELPKLPKVRDAEVEMAKTLVENLSEAFEPDRYHDRYRDELLDLMAALRASVERSQKAKRKPARKRASARKAS